MAARTKKAEILRIAEVLRNSPFPTGFIFKIIEPVDLRFIIQESHWSESESGDFAFGIQR